MISTTPLTLRLCYEQLHLPYLKLAGSSQSTIHSYRAMLSSWEQCGLGETDIREIRQSHLLQFQFKLIDLGRSPHTFRSKFKCLMAVLNTCLGEGLIESLPSTKRIKFPKIEEKPRPTVEQVEQIYLACEAATWPKGPANPRDYWRAIYAIAFLTCQRKGDILNLRFSEHVQADGLRIVPAKTRRYNKQIFVPYDPSGVLKHHLEVMRSHGKDRVFAGPRSNPYWADQTDRIAKASGLPKELITLQPIRRAGLDNWRIADRDAPGLMGGHSNSDGFLRDGYTPDITIRHYLSKERILKEAVKRLPIPQAMVPQIKGQLTLF